jgi:hypothetical protein
MNANGGLNHQAIDMYAALQRGKMAEPKMVANARADYALASKSIDGGEDTPLMRQLQSNAANIIASYSLKQGAGANVQAPAQQSSASLLPRTPAAPQQAALPPQQAAAVANVPSMPPQQVETAPPPQQSIPPAAPPPTPAPQPTSPASNLEYRQAFNFNADNG